MSPAAGPVEVVHEVVVAAPRAAAWAAFATDIASWWPQGFCSLPGARMVLEPVLGGRMYEDAGAGGGLVWYTVTGLRPGEALLLSGDIWADFGGPARSNLTISFEDAPGGTRVRVRDVLWAGARETLRTSMAKGWKTLLDDHLVPHLGGAATAAGTSRGSAASRAGRPAPRRRRRG